MNRFDCRLTRASPPARLPAQPAGDALDFDNGEMQVRINLRTGLLDAYRVSGRGLPAAGRAARAGDGRFARPVGHDRAALPPPARVSSACYRPGAAPGWRRSKRLRWPRCAWWRTARCARWSRRSSAGAIPTWCCATSCPSRARRSRSKRACTGMKKTACSN